MTDEDLNLSIAGIEDAINGTLISPNESDSNGEAANVVDGLFAIARAISRLAEAVSKHGEGK